MHAGDKEGTRSWLDILSFEAPPPPPHTHTHSYELVYAPAIEVTFLL